MKFVREIIEAGHITVEVFKELLVFSQIKMEFDGKAFVGSFDTCRQKITEHNPEWDLFFLDEPDLIKAPMLEATEELPTDASSNKAPF